MQPVVPPRQVRATIILVLGLLAAWLAAGSLGWLAPPLQRALTWLALAAIVIAAVAGRRRISRSDGLLLGGAASIAVLMTASSAAGRQYPGRGDLAGGRCPGATGIDGPCVRPRRLGGHGAGRFPAGLRWLGRRLDVHEQRGPRRGVVGRLVDGPAAADRRELRRPRLSGAHGGPDRRLAHRRAATAHPPRRDGPCCSSFLRRPHILSFWPSATTWPHCCRRKRSPSTTTSRTWASGPGATRFVSCCRGTCPCLPPSSNRGGRRHVPPDRRPSTATRSLRGTGIPPLRRASAETAAFRAGRRFRTTGRWNWRRFGPAGLLIVAAVALTLSPVQPDLKGRRIVAYDDGTTDWSTTDPGTVPPGRLPRYGLLPALVESLGGEFLRSRDLADLHDADVLIVLPPRSAVRLAAAARQLRNRFPTISKAGFGGMSSAGGRMIVAGEPETNLGVEENVLNALLAPTAMSFRDDTANSLTERWEDNLQSAPHAATASSNPGRSHFSLDRAASIRAGVARRAAAGGTLGLGRTGHRPGPARSLVLFAGQSPGRPGACGPAERAAGERWWRWARRPALSNDGIPFSYTFTGPAAFGVGRQAIDAAGLVAADGGRGGRGRGDRALVAPLRTAPAWPRRPSPWRWPCSRAVGSTMQRPNCCPRATRPPPGRSSMWMARTWKRWARIPGAKTASAASCACWPTTVTCRWWRPILRRSD